MNLSVRNIGRLLTMTGPVETDAAVVIRDGRVAWTGPAAALPVDAPEEVLDADGSCVVPGFVDAHTHLVYAGVRREEFVARLAGQRYDGGGIRTTVAATNAASTAELVELAAARAAEAVSNGTTTMEIKTGYGLTRDEELRLLDVIATLAERTPLRLEPTYLGAHAVPADRDRTGYVEEVVATLPAAAAKGARWCDVFCDEGVFTVAEARTILTAAREQGLGLRIHAEEIAPTGRLRWRPSWAVPAPTISSTCPRPTPVRWRRRGSPQCCCPPSLCRCARRRGVMPPCCARRESSSRWRRTATRGRRGASRCPTRSSWPAWRWGSRWTRRSGRRR